LLHDTSNRRVRDAVFDPALHEIDRDLLFSVQSDGIVEALKAIQSTMVVRDGNRRLHAALWLKLEKVPVVFLDEDEETAQRQTVAVALNRKDLTPEELGKFLLSEMERTGEDQQTTARRLKISTAKCSRAIRSVKFPSNGKKKELESASVKVGEATARVTYGDIAEARSALSKLMKELS
jgi:ParB/RepB/Spo0J family partition protein